MKTTKTSDIPIENRPENPPKGSDFPSPLETTKGYVTYLKTDFNRIKDGINDHIVQPHTPYPCGTKYTFSVVFPSFPLCHD